MSFVIYSYPNNPRVFKAQIAGKFSGVEIELKEISLEKGEHKTPEFLKINPLGKVPTLQGPDGAISESNAIARYIARQNNDPGHLYGRSVYQSGLVDQWIDYAANEIDLPAAAWLYPIFGIVPDNAEATKTAKGDVRKALQYLDSHLAAHQFLVGDRFSLADIVVAMSLSALYKLVLDAGYRKQFTNTNRWFLLVVNQPKVKEVIGEFKLCEKMAIAPKVVAAPAAAASSSQAKPAPAPKAKAAPKPKDDDEEEENEALAAERAVEAKDPWVGVPEIAFNFKTWKVNYSNNPFRTDAWPWFLQNFEAEKMSIWFCDYLYNDELTQTFRVNNLVGGFTQRVAPKLNNNTFGIFLIFGSEPTLAVHGAFLFRGTEIPELFKENPDFDAYKWTRADLSKEDERDYLSALWGWDVASVATPASLGGKSLTYDVEAQMGCQYK